jgi:hypothetical protein
MYFFFIKWYLYQISLFYLYFCRVSWANARPNGKQVRYRKNSEIKSKQAQEALDAAQLHFSFIAKQVSTYTN